VTEKPATGTRAAPSRVAGPQLASPAMLRRSMRPMRAPAACSASRSACGSRTSASPPSCSIWSAASSIDSICTV